MNSEFNYHYYNSQQASSSLCDNSFIFFLGNEFFHSSSCIAGIHYDFYRFLDLIVLLLMLLLLQLLLFLSEQSPLLTQSLLVSFYSSSHYFSFFYLRNVTIGNCSYSSDNRNTKCDGGSSSRKILETHDGGILCLKKDER